MAEIPVTKKSGVPWWLWLLLALLVAALLYWLFADKDRAEPVNDRVVATQPVVNDGVITTLPALMGAPLNTMVGRQVALTGVPVQSLAGDESFYIGDSATNRAFVTFNEQPTPNQAMEGNVDVNPGSMVDITGTVRAASDMPAGKTLPAGTDAYIFADKVDVK